MQHHSLAISEQFKSVQGEGPYTGVSAIFLRLKGCNLLCGGPGTIASKKPEGLAQWRCDTIEVWREGTAISIADLLTQWQSKGWLSDLKNGTHLVITGGEPLLQLNGIITLLDVLETQFDTTPFVEFETNGTVSPGQLKNRHNCHFNISPKCQSSGVEKSLRYKTDILKEFTTCDKICFKFVVCDTNDCQEIETDFIKALQIPKSTIYFMPGADNRITLKTLLPKVAKWQQKWGVHLSTRLHIHAWNQKTGV